MLGDEEIENLPNEIKSVTIRKADARLYDKFVLLAKKYGKPTGVFFGVVMKFVYRDLSPFFMFKPYHLHRKRYTVETIKELDELVVEYKDLAQIKGKAFVNFYRINKLIFDKEINGELLLETVGVIKECNNVVFQGNIPELVKYGLVVQKPSYSYPTDPTKLKDVTIRNVPIQLYNLLLYESKREGKTIGEYFSEKLFVALPKLELFLSLRGNLGVFPLIIFDIPKITVKNKDLEVLKERKVVFYQIKELIFAKDVLEDLFLKNIVKIINCESVTLPQSLPKLIVLARVENCKKVEFHN